MDLKNRNVLVIGLGLSGISTIKTLDKLGANIYLVDAKNKVDLKDDFDKLDDIKLRAYLGGEEPILDNIDLLVKNPGVPFDNEIVLRAKELDIDVVTDLELAYRLGLTENLLVITGTNGKTTTTTLVGDIFKNAKKTTHVVGNIGLGILWELFNGNKDDIAVIEASSFQLDACTYLKPKVSSILNITPDHLNWHKTYENYINAKQKVQNMQDENDFTVLNYDDEEVRKIGEQSKANVVWFSRKEVLDKGVFLDKDSLIIKDGEKNIEVIKKGELNIPGAHNIENALASIGITYSMGIDVDIIRESLREFKAVEHRIEYIDTINEVKFYNDSKGTNIDASIKAIEAIEENIILIAGGADKGCSYDDFIATFETRVKHLVLLGETKYDIEKTALKFGFNSIDIVDNMEEAVKIAFDKSEEKDNILLSPACASLDMYKSFEARGEDFRRNVSLLKEV